MLTYMTNLCKQSRTSGIKSLQVELPETHLSSSFSNTQPGSLMRNHAKSDGLAFLSQN